MLMVNENTSLKIKKKTHKKFKQAKRLKEFQLDESITTSQFLEHLLEKIFSEEFDNLSVIKSKKN